MINEDNFLLEYIEPDRRPYQVISERFYYYNQVNAKGELIAVWTAKKLKDNK